MIRTWSQWRTRKDPATATLRHGRLLRLEALEDRLVLTLLPAVNYTTGLSPDIPAIGDLTGDGFNDVVVTNASSNTVSVFLNKGLGDGSLGPKTDYAVGTAPNGLVIADLAGRGINDIVAANYFANTVSVLMGNGDGTFQAAKNYTAGAGSASVVVGDFNKDGIPDIATANYTGASVSVLLGNGDGSFQAPINTPAGNKPVSIAAADFNGDGNLDLVVPNQSTGGASVLLGNGNGTFKAAQFYATGAFADGVATGDLNNDGAPDFVVGNANANTVSILINKNDGTGTFNPAVNISVTGGPSAVAIADLNHDGNMDVISANQYSTGNSVTVLLGKGNGTFPVHRTYGVGTLPLGVAAGDLTGTSYNSIVAGNVISNTISVLVNDGNWRPPSPSPSTGAISGQPVPVPQLPASTTLAQVPTTVPSAVTSTDAVFTDSSLVGAVHHHHTQADDTGLDWTSFLS
jgi:hypothetical protein